MILSLRRKGHIGSSVEIATPKDNILIWNPLFFASRTIISLSDALYYCDEFDNIRLSFSKHKNTWLCFSFFIRNKSLYVYNIIYRDYENWYEDLIEDLIESYETHNLKKVFIKWNTISNKEEKSTLVNKEAMRFKEEMSKRGINIEFLKSDEFTKVNPKCCLFLFSE